MNSRYVTVRAGILILALSALACSEASAYISSSAYPATITGTQISGSITGGQVSKHQLKTAVGTLECSKTTYTSSSLTETQTSLVLTPTYESCPMLGIGATINTNGCKTRWEPEKATGSSAADLLVHLECPVGQAISISFSGLTCQTTIPSQTLQGIETTNEGSGDVKALIDITNLHYIIHNGSKCPNQPASGTYTDGSTKVAVTLQGNNGKIEITGPKGPEEPPEQPANGHFTSENYPATITAIQVEGVITGKTVSKHEFFTKAGTVKCNTATASGALTSTATVLTLTPTYAGCTIAGIGATVNMNSCHFRLQVEGEETEGTSALRTQIVCPVGNEVVVSVVGSSCKVTIPAQTLAGADAHNGLTDIKATIDLEGVNYTIDEGKKCPNTPANGSYADGSYKGASTLSGNNGVIAATEPPFVPANGHFVSAHYPASVVAMQVAGEITGKD